MIGLMAEARTDCVLMDKKTESDGLGGVITNWTEGAKFFASIVLDDSIQAQVAEVQGAKGKYTISTDKTILMRDGDVFKRLSDNKVFRVVTDGDDKKTPVSANISFRQVKAEEWQL